MTALAITQQAQTDGRRSQTFKLAKRRYAIGLVWLATAEGDHLEKVARSEASSRKTNLYVTRKTDGGAQYGLGLKADGLQAGSIAAAAAIGDQIRGAFCAVFPIDGGWWFVAQREDLITPYGDAFYDSEEAAKARLVEAINEGEWNRVIAPAEWSLANTEVVDAAELLMLAKSPRLRSLSTIATYLIPVVIVLAVSGALFFGVKTFLDYRQAQQDEEAFRLIQEELARKADEDARKNAPKSPWQDEVVSSAMVEACGRVFGRIQPIAPGWAVASVECDVKGTGKIGAQWKWKRSVGPVSWLNAWLAQTYGSEIADATFYDNGGNDAVTQLMIAELPKRGQEELIEERAAVLKFLTLAQSVGADLKLGRLNVPQPPEGVKPENWTPPGYASMKWELKTSGIQGWSHQLALIPGLIISTIDFNPSENGYAIKGELYVQN